jgi:hypothetical protein
MSAQRALQKMIGNEVLEWCESSVNHHTLDRSCICSKFYIPLTPLPGTPYWDAALWDPTGAAFRRFDFLPFGNNNGQAALDRELFRCFASHWPSARWRAYWPGLSHANARKRRMAWNLFCRGTRNAVNSIYARPRALPAWYEN